MSPTSHSVSPRGEPSTVVPTATHASSHHGGQHHGAGPAPGPPNANYGNGNYWYYEEGREPGSTGQRYEEWYHRRRGSGVRDTVVM